MGDAQEVNEELEELVPRPISSDDASELAREFYRRFPVSMIRLQRALFDLMDHGEIVALTTREMDALSDHLTALQVRIFIDRDTTVNPQLASAVKKLAFAHGRHYGLMNIDMGILPDEEVSVNGR
jgi:hypothetical protein